MALSPSSLASSLENDWLVPEDGDYPASATESGDRFAAAVADWFGMAMASGIPCSTASARKSGLAAQAAAALSAQSAQAAGAQLGLAVATYMAGQAFGPGVATFPAAAAAGVNACIAVFSDLEMTNNARAQQIATGCFSMAVSTIVVFPPVLMPPAPIS